MEEEATNESDDGGRGEGVYLTPVQANKLYGMAIRQQWPLSNADKEDAVKACRKNLASDDGRISNGAVRNLLTMNAQNMAQEEADKPKTPAAGTTVNVAVGVSVQSVRQELLHDPEYLAYLRNREIESNGDAGVIREGGEPRALEVGPTPRDAGSGHNGHANGKGRH